MATHQHREDLPSLHALHLRGAIEPAISLKHSFHMNRSRPLQPVSANSRAMPSTTTPRGKKRENKYFDVGKQGRWAFLGFTVVVALIAKETDRKTGITLKDTGVRDADGLEPIDGIFSSPEKSPPKPRNDANKTLPPSQVADIAQS